MTEQKKIEQHEGPESHEAASQQQDEREELRELAGRIRTRLVAGFVADEEGSGA